MLNISCGAGNRRKGLQFVDVFVLVLCVFSKDPLIALLYLFENATKEEGKIDVTAEKYIFPQLSAKIKLLP